MIFIFATCRIPQTKVKETLDTVITIKNTSAMTRHHLKDFMVEVQALKISKPANGRCGMWNGFEARFFE